MRLLDRNVLLSRYSDLIFSGLPKSPKADLDQVKQSLFHHITCRYGHPFVYNFSFLESQWLNGQDKRVYVLHSYLPYAEPLLVFEFTFP